MWSLVSALEGLTRFVAISSGTRKKKRGDKLQYLTPFFFTCATSISNYKRTRALRPEVSGQSGKLFRNSASTFSISPSDNLTGLMTLTAKYPKIIAVPIMTIRSDPNFSIITALSQADTIGASPKFDFASRWPRDKASVGLVGEYCLRGP